MKKIIAIILGTIMVVFPAVLLANEIAESRDSYYVKTQNAESLQTFVDDNVLLLEHLISYPNPSPQTLERFGCYYVLTVPQDRLTGDLIERVMALPGVERVEKVYPAEIERGYHPPASVSGWNSPDTFDDPYTPTDPLYPEQYHHRIIGTHWAWNVSTGEGVMVTIMDCGSQTDHPDLAPNLDAESDHAEGMGHGTWVAGILGAKMDNDIGVAGVAGNCTVLCLDQILASGIPYAVDRGAKVISMSILTEYSQTDQEAVDYAWEQGVFLCASAGNDNDEMWPNKYPARYEHVMAVGATDRHDQRWVDDDEVNGSNYGDDVIIYAPGDSIFTTLNTDSLWPDYNVDEEYGLPYWPSGTSFSTPIVAGVAALLYSVHPDWTSQQVWDRLIETSDTLSLDVGDVLRVNAARALDAVPGIEEPVTPPGTHPDWEVVSPVGSRIVLRFSNSPNGFHAVIFDAAGRKVDELHSDGQSGTITWGECYGCYGPGVYFIRDESDSPTTHKVVLIQ